MPSRATEPEAPPEVVRYGPDTPTEDELRLLGNVAGRRVLLLGCHSPRSCVALAQQGAKVIVFDPSGERLAKGREACETAEVKAEFRNLDLADLAHVQGESVDLAVSIYTIGEVQDLDRLLRQVHRVLAPGATFVLSLPHPALAMLDRSSTEPVQVARPYLDTTDPTTAERTHVPSALFGSLGRAKFRVDALLEPPAVNPRDRTRWVPPAMILRARKEGV